MSDRLTAQLVFTEAQLTAVADQLELSLDVADDVADVASDNGLMLPTVVQCKRWVSAVLLTIDAQTGECSDIASQDKAYTAASLLPAELSIRIIDDVEMTALNDQYRDKAYPTNVLSFPTDLPDIVQQDLGVNILGDMAICANVVATESETQNKLPLHHWAHLVVHSTLHLLGYDHQVDAEAEVMERQEITILRGLGIDNPYR